MIAFPSNPSVNDTYTAAGKTWLWTGTAWQLQPRILTSADITDFATAVGNVAPPTTDASLLTSGTLPNARLSADVTTSLGKADTALQSGAAISSISGLQTALDGKATSAQGALADSALQPGAAISSIDGLQSELDGKQPAGDYATLVDGVVSASQLPSFVEDVVEFANLAAFPATGEAGKLYLALDTGKVYRWSGSTYVEIVASPGSTDAVPEGTNNLYFTTQRAADAAPVQTVAGRTGEVTLGISDVTDLQTNLDGKQIKTVYADTAPAHAAGLEWVDTNELRAYRSYNSQWVEIDRV